MKIYTTGGNLICISATDLSFFNKIEKEKKEKDECM